MYSRAIWEIIALSHVLEGRVISRGEASSFTVTGPPHVSVLFDLILPRCLF